MTDLDLVRELCKRLNLKLVEYEWPEGCEYSDSGLKLTIGCGAGYSGFAVVFSFHKDGKIHEYAVVE